MEFFSAEFFSALAAIIVIDLVLAGDNAIVIALAVRNLPRKLQRKAILWGTVGAIVVRALMTMVVVSLLKVPGLMLVGGLALLWIACGLLTPEGGDAHAEVAPGMSFWGAMKTIVVADAVMGLDNVLAVGGAAQGSFLLVVLGLAISIPIVVWGSSLILRWIGRFPSIIYAGAAVLAWTTAKMLTGEPALRDWFGEHGTVTRAIYVVAIAGVLGIGYLRQRRGTAARDAMGA